MRYKQKLIHDNFIDTSSVGSYDDEDPGVGVALVGAPACGDVLKLYIAVQNNIIKDAKILVFGCGSAKASSNLGVKKLINKTLEQASDIQDKEIAADLDLPKSKFHCSVLMESAIKKAIDNYKEKQMKNNKLSDTSLKFKINISDSAKKYIEDILSKINKKILGIRIALQESNCGLSYKIKYVEDGKDISNDIIYKIDNLCVFVSQNVAEIINGTTMDLKEENLKKTITFINPNEVGKCGCGINFKLSNTKSDESKCDN